VTDDQIKALVLREIKKVAPEAELDGLDPAADLRDQIDLDSMDVLNVMIAIHESTGVEIPEADYPQLATLDAAVAYLRARIKDR
jgi:acyl carrier protein